ncbi:MAG TPA: glycoside hydrolase family 15 protein [Cyclobacteriaceae bacterium]|nr:glycoside hydrolase family 15 protein [Cyclobacteriaceae bacterium]
MNYQPIEDYGVVGDLNTVALVGLNGSIDFLCFPDFDAPSIFAALLDKEKGGYFKITPVFGEMHNKQLYLPDTNVLLTRFLSSEGVGELTDFMPVEELYEGHVLIRRLTNVRGVTRYKMVCQPRFNYGRARHRIEVVNTKCLLFHSPDMILRLRSTVDLAVEVDAGVAEFILEPNQIADFVLELHDHRREDERQHLSDLVDKELKETLSYWKDWAGRSQYNGRWREIVNRSALTLKLLISHRYGSIVAAPTFSLPEHIGGERNWDYRYTWIRDASFTVYSLMHLGYIKEMEKFMQWVEKLFQHMPQGGGLKLMYTVAGNKEVDEQILDHLEGYKASAPVRIGNNAHMQLQLDIYGELLDAVYLFNKYGSPISYGFWKNISQQIDWVARNWDQEDEGIWEVRGGRKKFLYSRLMCWVALDRAIKIGHARSFPQNPAWCAQRDLIFQSIYERFWNEERKCFVQFEGSDNVDAALLLMPLVRFISPKDPMWLSTLKVIEEDLVSDSLVYRYRHEKAADDGLGHGEGTFSMCSFWYIECLSRAGQLQKARLYFEKMIGYANHLGLYAEQLGFQGEHLGNFPQAFTHLGLITAAFNLDRQLDNQRNRQDAAEEEWKKNK